ncbi:hypothetical protein ACFRAE_16345 [Sphingobacterium sp. HJSM2_6]|uniref:hypothetical protein n=1 Tax=Sphingobacterium sp. HJSM2_6 TaxID=3366264 RepID=UPI003BDCCB19
MSNTTNEKDNNNDIKIIDGKEYVLTKVEKLEDYLLALDSTDVKSLTKANKKFKELFSEQDSLENDLAVLSILDYFDKVSTYATPFIFEEKVDYRPLVDIEFNKASNDIPSPLENTYETINENGLRVKETEGMFMLEVNPLYIQKEYYPFISKNLEIYLQQLGKENIEGFAQDAAIVIPFQSLVQRTIWWEDFSNSTKNSAIGKKATDLYNYYFSNLCIGMDNTPAIESEQIAAYFQDAYNYLKEIAPNSTTYQRLKLYVELLEQEKIDEAKSLVPGLISNE